jgi:hypothetical protein
VRSAFAPDDQAEGHNDKVSEHQAHFLPEYVKASIDQWDLVEADVESLPWETEQL